MADEEIKTEAPSEQTPKVKEQQKEESVQLDDWEQLSGGKFKSGSDLAKAYKDLETKLGQQSDKVRQSEEFANVIQPLLDEIRKDPVIFETLDTRLREKANPSQSENKEDPKKTTGQEEVRTVASDILLAQFEARHGIDKLSPEEQKDLRTKIGSVITETTGQNLNAIDLRRLNTVLENAYVVANKDKSSQEATVSDTEEGQPAIPASQSKAETKLTPEEAQAAEKLGLSREQYLSGKKV